MAKRKIGELYGKSIVEGDNNIITSNEISINSLDAEGGYKLPFKINKCIQITPKDNSLVEDIDTYETMIPTLIAVSTMITYEGYLASPDVYSRLMRCPRDFTNYSFFLSVPFMLYQDDGDGHYNSTLIESFEEVFGDENLIIELYSEKFNIKYINLK